MQYDRYTLIMSKKFYNVTKCCLLRQNKNSCVVGIPGGTIKIVLNEYIYTNEYEATEQALSLNEKIKKAGEIDGKQKTS